MKSIATLLLSLFSTVLVFPQSPEAFKYQAVLRNASGQIIANQAVGLKLSILQGTSTGTVVYSETHTLTTSAVGLATAEIGNGTILTGTFASINWSAGPFFLKVELDAAGGSNYVLFGTSQLLSVPYALYAKKAGSATETDPIFNASLAKKITASDTLRWGKKLPVGTAGNLLTYDGTNWIAKDVLVGPTGGGQPISIRSPYLGISYCIALQGIFPSRNGSDTYIAEIMLFGGNFEPKGYAFCNGQLLSIAQNTALFSLLGTTYGGDGRTTFALPDLRGRTPVHVGQGTGLSNIDLGETGGTESVTLTIGNLPPHTHPLVK